MFGGADALRSGDVQLGRPEAFERIDHRLGMQSFR
jgi:hypothetical protein